MSGPSIKRTLCLLAAAIAGCGSPQTTSTRDAAREADRSEPLPGLSAFTAEMLLHGAGDRTTDEIAEAIEFVGGDLSIEKESDYVAVEARVLADELDLAMGLVADLVLRPTFPEEEIEKVRRRELDRLSLMAQRPSWLAEQELYRALYGDRHPYGHQDAEPEAIRRLGREDLVSFHRTHYVPRNAFLVVVGDFRTADLRALAERQFGAWPDLEPPTHDIPVPPVQTKRQVVVVDRPGSTQADIRVGNVALRRADQQFIPLRVSNVILGGNASARLFMNLRERCGYGYGAYSSVASVLAPGPLAVSAAVEDDQTAGALRELFAELERITAAPASAEELSTARAYLDGVFPMITETAANLASLVTIERVYGLPEGYWSTYRSSIMAVTSADAHAAAGANIHPDRAALIIVGDAGSVAFPARRYGDVRIVSPAGTEVGFLRGATGEWPGGEPPPCPATGDEQPRQGTSSPPEPSPPADFAFPAAEEFTLANGLPVVAIERRQLPLVHLRMVVRSGSASDPL